MCTCWHVQWRGHVGIQKLSNACTKNSTGSTPSSLLDRDSWRQRVRLGGEKQTGEIYRGWKKEEDRVGLQAEGKEYEEPSTRKVQRPKPPVVEAWERNAGETSTNIHNVHCWRKTSVRKCVSLKISFELLLLCAVHLWLISEAFAYPETGFLSLSLCFHVSFLDILPVLHSLCACALVIISLTSNMQVQFVQREKKCTWIKEHG